MSGDMNFGVVGVDIQRWQRARVTLWGVIRVCSFLDTLYTAYVGQPKPEMLHAGATYR